MLKKKSSVQISIEGQNEKNLEVPTFIIKYWKTLTVSALSVIVVLFGTLSIVAAKKNEELSHQYEATLGKMNAQNRQLSEGKSEAEQNIIEAKKSFEKIDSTLESLNNRMQKRGLKRIALADAGGPIEADPENLELLSDYYTDMVNKLDDELSNLPLGKPFDGEISSKFGYRANPFTNRGREMHSGVDFRGRLGTSVMTTANGVVSFAGFEGDYGYVVKVKHKNGYETRYAHLLRPLVKAGQKLEAGQIVGLLGNTGRSTGPHVHYEILKDNKKINPEKYLTF